MAKVAYLKLRIEVDCEACGESYNYEKGRSNTKSSPLALLLPGTNLLAKHPFPALIEEFERRDFVLGAKRCPKCGYTQSWMITDTGKSIDGSGFPLGLLGFFLFLGAGYLLGWPWPDIGSRQFAALAVYVLSFLILTVGGGWLGDRLEKPANEKWHREHGDAVPLAKAPRVFPVCRAGTSTDFKPLEPAGDVYCDGAAYVSHIDVTLADRPRRLNVYCRLNDISMEDAISALRAKRDERRRTSRARGNNNQ